VRLIVGFALGFGVRSALSRYRRAQLRKRINRYETSTVGKRQPLISAASFGG
jgi:hypothetical protein